MKKIDYRKIFTQLLKEYPHDLDKIEKVQIDAKTHGSDISLSFEDIIKSNIWSVNEMIRLLIFFGYDKYDHFLQFINEDGTLIELSDYEYLIKFGMLNGFSALMKTYQNGRLFMKEIYMKNCIDESAKNNRYLKVLATIKRECKDKDKSSFIRVVLKYLPENLLKDLSIFIIDSKDIRLIKKYIDYIDVDFYLKEAAATGKIDIVKLFLSHGAKKEHLINSIIPSEYSPIEVAISNNDYKMVKFINENGIHDNKTRLASILEFATKFECKKSYCYNIMKVCLCNNEYSFDIYNIPESLKIRSKIVDFIFDNMDNLEIINYNYLIAYTLMVRDLTLFKKYSGSVDEHKSINISYLFDIYFAFHRDQDERFIIPFLDFVKSLNNKYDAYSKLLDYYVENIVKPSKVFFSDAFNEELLKRIPIEKRKDICLVPYCKNLTSLNVLLKLGYDINQRDDDNKSILFHLLSDKSDISDIEMELFKYLVKNADVSIRDNNNNKTALYYAMQKFNTRNEFSFADRKHKVKVRTNLEKAVGILISKMEKVDVCNEDIKTVLEGRMEAFSEYGDMIYLECVYEHHKDLFDALLDKGFHLSDKMLKKIFDSIYPKEHLGLDKIIDLDKTKEYLYTKLDRNNEIQVLNIEEEFNNLENLTEYGKLTFAEFITRLKEFNNKIVSLKDFYEFSIKNKFNPERYLEYAKEKFYTVYDNLDGYLLLIIIIGLKKFGDDKLEDILEALPNYNLNSFVEGADINLYKEDYIAQVSDVIGVNHEGKPIYDINRFKKCKIEEKEYGRISFTGTLVQYAILKDNLELVKLLQKRGASLTLFIDGCSHTWDYVNSKEMKDYLESVIGDEYLSTLDEEEKAYYLSLFDQQFDADGEKPVRLTLGRSED